jgi:hypothetical protein
MRQLLSEKFGELYRIVLFRLREKKQRCRIDAVSLSGRRRAVWEEMPQMRIAFGA